MQSASAARFQAPEPEPSLVELRRRLQRSQRTRARLRSAERCLTEIRALLRVAFADDLGCLPAEEAAAIAADPVRLAEHAVRRTRPGLRPQVEALHREASR